MKSLNSQDLYWLTRRLPKEVHTMMINPNYPRIFVGGGWIRETIMGQPPSDIDLFSTSLENCERIATDLLAPSGHRRFNTENAITIHGLGLPVQIITRWLFKAPEDLLASFDFTMCCAALWWDGQWKSMCDDGFYEDLAAKRLHYREPVRVEEPGGSLLRAFKFTARGWNIPLEDIAKVTARMLVDYEENGKGLDTKTVVAYVARKLRSVDPAIDQNGNPTNQHDLVN